MEVRNRFKGLDLIDRVPDELSMEVCDIVQETGIKTIPKKKKCKKTKWMSGEALKIAVKRREAKRKEEKERYTHLNAEFQRISPGPSRQPGATLLELRSVKENRNSLIFRKVTTTPAFFQSKGPVKPKPTGVPGSGQGPLLVPSALVT